MAQWRRSRICSYCLIECIEYEWIVVPISNHKRDDSSVVKVKDRTKIDFMLLLVFVIPFELGYIGEPFLVWLICCEFSVQDILCNELRIICLTCTSVVCILDRGLDVSCSTDPESPLVIDPDAIVTIQVVIYSAVSLGRILHMDFFHLFSNKSILPNSFTDITTQPLVIC